MSLKLLQLWISVRPSLRLGLLLSIMLGLAVLFGGCAPLSKATYESCEQSGDNEACIAAALEQKAWEAEWREAMRVEDFIRLKAYCESQPDLAMWYVHNGGSTASFKRTGIPDRGTRYGCADPRHIMDAIYRGY